MSVSKQGRTGTERRTSPQEYSGPSDDEEEDDEENDDDNSFWELYRSGQRSQLNISQKSDEGQ